MATKNSRTLPVGYHATTAPGMFIEVTASYTSGSWNGYCLSFTPTKLSISCGGFACSSFMMFSGKALKVEPASRFNAKRLAAIAALAPNLPDYTVTVAALAAKENLTLTGEVLSKSAAFTAAPSES